MVFISTAHIGDRAARKAIDECAQELNQREKELRQREERVQEKEQALSSLVATLLDKKEIAEGEFRSGWEKLKNGQAELDAAKTDHAEAMKKAERELELSSAVLTQRELDIDERMKAMQRRERMRPPQRHLPPTPEFRLLTAGSAAFRTSNTNSLASFSWFRDEQQQASPDEIEQGKELERPIRLKRRCGYNVFVSEVAPTMVVKARMQNLCRMGAIKLAREAWKSLPDEKKAEWNAKAAEQNQVDAAAQAQNSSDCGKMRRRNL